LEGGIDPLVAGVDEASVEELKKPLKEKLSI
jgi:hypothetical protein